MLVLKLSPIQTYLKAYNFPHTFEFIFCMNSLFVDVWLSLIRCKQIERTITIFFKKWHGNNHTGHFEIAIHCSYFYSKREGLRNIQNRGRLFFIALASRQDSIYWLGFYVLILLSVSKYNFAAFTTNMQNFVRIKNLSKYDLFHNNNQLLFQSDV